jgi:hypothetical protein
MAVRKVLTDSHLPSLLAIGGSVFVAITALSTQSFWIDEAHTAWKAVQPTLSGWWTEMVADHGSDLQMPFYMFYSWVWEKIFGHSEWWMRAANVPWFLAGLLAIAQRQRALLLVTIASPFAWYCIDEARPYAMQLGTSLLIFAAFGRLFAGPGAGPVREERRWTVWLACGLVLLSGSSLLGLYWAGVGLGGGLLVFPLKRTWVVIRSQWFVWLAALPCLVGLAIYYLWTLRSGARPYSGASTDAKNILYFTYELLGFGGLGPGRSEIRARGLPVFRTYLFPLLAYGVVLAAVLGAGARRAYRTIPPRTLIRAAVTCGVAVLFLVVVGYVTHFRLLGRHLTPLLPIVLWSVAAGLTELLDCRTVFARCLAVCFLVGSLASCVSLRFASRHAKDGYREAAGVARAALTKGGYREAATVARTALARGGVVWWNADKIAGQFYGVRFVESGTVTTPGGAWLITNCDREALSRAPVPQLIVSSKADLYDSIGALAEYVSQHGYQEAGAFPAFTFWHKAPS